MTSLLRAIRDYADGVLGGDRYERYLEHHRASAAPGEQPMTEREFWRSHQDWQDRNPQGRCC